MIFALEQSGRVLSFDRLQQVIITSGVAGRLLLAAALGGAVGIDREYHHKPSGVRTNLLICFGAALFTFLSSIIAGEGSTNKGQIASNIVQGIGFLGAGLILHNRDRVSGLTSAATVWAVASIGMACGAENPRSSGSRALTLLSFARKSPPRWKTLTRTIIWTPRARDD